MRTTEPDDKFDGLTLAEHTRYIQRSIGYFSSLANELIGITTKPHLVSQHYQDNPIHTDITAIAIATNLTKYHVILYHIYIPQLIKSSMTTINHILQLARQSKKTEKKKLNELLNTLFIQTYSAVYEDTPLGKGLTRTIINTIKNIHLKHNPFFIHFIANYFNIKNLIYKHKKLTHFHQQLTALAYNIYTKQLIQSIERTIHFEIQELSEQEKIIYSSNRIIQSLEQSEYDENCTGVLRGLALKLIPYLIRTINTDSDQLDTTSKLQINQLFYHYLKTMIYFPEEYPQIIRSIHKTFTYMKQNHPQKYQSLKNFLTTKKTEIKQSNSPVQILLTQLMNKEKKKRKEHSTYEEKTQKEISQPINKKPKTTRPIRLYM
jgi:hypothetical protein